MKRWPIADRADDMTRADRLVFERITRGVRLVPPPPSGVHVISTPAGEHVTLYAPSRSRFRRLVDRVWWGIR